MRRAVSPFPTTSHSVRECINPAGKLAPFILDYPAILPVSLGGNRPTSASGRGSGTAKPEVAVPIADGKGVAMLFQTIAL